MSFNNKLHGYHLPKFLAPTLFITLFIAGCQAASNTPTAIAIPTTLTATALAQATETPTLPPEPSPTIIPTNTPIPTITPTSLPTNTPTAEPSPTLAAGAAQTSPKDGMVLLFVPAGEFILGSKPNDEGADTDEFPQRTITLDAYWIDQTEVTNAMFAAFLNETGGPVTGEPAWLNSFKDSIQLVNINGQWQPIAGLEDHPVVEVTWYGSDAYCTWAGRHLPTEAEWEKAARGTDERIYPWGGEIDCDHALYGNCGPKYTFRVGSFPEGASPYGALDMSGNVWEWVADWYAVDTYVSMPDANPIGPETGTARVVRGGSFDYNAKHNRLTDRRNDGPANSSYDYGFRCAASAVSP